MLPQINTKARPGSAGNTASQTPTGAGYPSGSQTSRQPSLSYLPDDEAALLKRLQDIEAKIVSRNSEFMTNDQKRQEAFRRKEERDREQRRLDQERRARETEEQRVQREYEQWKQERVRRQEWLLQHREGEEFSPTSYQSPRAAKLAQSTPSQTPTKNGTAASHTAAPPKEVVKIAAEEEEGEAGEEHQGTGFASFDTEKFDLGSPTSQQAHADDRRRSRRVAVSAKVMDDDDSFTPPVIPKSPRTKLELERILRINPLMNTMEPEDLAVLCGAMESREYEKGTTILKEGEYNDFFFIIGKGQITVKKDNLSLGKLSEGMAFGELELMYSAKCEGSVICDTPVQTWVLDGNTYRKILMKVHVEKRKLYEELMKNVDMLKSMSHLQLLTLADALSPAYYKAGDYLIRFGEDGKYMHIVLEGNVEVWGRSPEIGVHSVCTFTTGEPIGELEFINNHRCVADVIAVTDVKTVRLDRDHFEMCMGPITDLLKERTATETYSYYTGFDWDKVNDMGNFLDAVGQGDDEEFIPKPPEGRKSNSRSRREGVSSTIAGEATMDDFVVEKVDKPESHRRQIWDVIRKKPLFSHLEDEVVEQLIDAFLPHKFQECDIIVSEGSEDDRVYVILEGEAESSIGEKFGKNACVLEEQLMYSSKIKRTISCISSVLAYSLQRNVYQQTVSRVSRERRALYEDLLSKVDFLKSMQKQEILQLADCLQAAEFKPGDTIIKYGSEGEYMHVIVEGTVSVLGRKDNGDVILVCEFNQGAPIGELEFIYPNKTVADCIAKTHVKTVKLGRNHFELCMGPVKEALRGRAKMDIYKYYQNTTSLA